MRLTSRDIVLGRMISVGILFLCVWVSPVYCQDETRWWQRETPAPSSSQAISQDYLAKKRQLEQAWDQLQRDMKERVRYKALGHDVSTFNNMISSSRQKVRVFEEELRKIPMYVDRKSADTLGGNHVKEYGSVESSLTSSQFRGVLYMSFADAGVNAPHEIGVLRFKMDAFPFSRDSMSYSSYQRLGPLWAYIVRIYPPDRLDDWKKSIKTQQELQSAGFKQQRVNNYYSPENRLRGFFVEKGAKQMMELQDYLKENLPKGKPAEFCILAESLPPFVDIPVPVGTYYIEYSLKFNKNRISRPPNVHPNYPSKSPEQMESVEWGPPKVRALPGRVAQIQFKPSSNINFYDYPFENWENSKAQWDYVEYLIWNRIRDVHK